MNLTMVMLFMKQQRVPIFNVQVKVLGNLRMQSYVIYTSLGAKNVILDTLLVQPFTYYAIHRLLLCLLHGFCFYFLHTMSLGYPQALCIPY